MTRFKYTYMAYRGAADKQSLFGLSTRNSSQHPEIEWLRLEHTPPP